MKTKRKVRKVKVPIDQPIIRDNSSPKCNIVMAGVVCGGTTYKVAGKGMFLCHKCKKFSSKSDYEAKHGIN